MSMTDPISDLLTRIRNAQSAKKLSVSMPASRLKAAVARVLEQEGYVTSVETDDAEGKAVLTVNLKYHEGQGVIEKLQRVSRPGLRIYRGANELPQVEGGLGVAIISTSKGVMSDRAARSQGHGGEVLCIVS